MDHHGFPNTPDFQEDVDMELDSSEESDTDDSMYDSQSDISDGILPDLTIVPADPRMPLEVSPVTQQLAVQSRRNALGPTVIDIEIPTRPLSLELRELSLSVDLTIHTPERIFHHFRELAVNASRPMENYTIPLLQLFPPLYTTLKVSLELCRDAEFMDMVQVPLVLRLLSDLEQRVRDLNRGYLEFYGPGISVVSTMEELENLGPIAPTGSSNLEQLIDLSGLATAAQLLCHLLQHQYTRFTVGTKFNCNVALLKADLAKTDEKDCSVCSEVVEEANIAIPLSDRFRCPNGHTNICVTCAEIWFSGQEENNQKCPLCRTDCSSILTDRLFLGGLLGVGLDELKQTFQKLETITSQHIPVLNNPVYSTLNIELATRRTDEQPEADNQAALNRVYASLTPLSFPINYPARLRGLSSRSFQLTHIFPRFHQAIRHASGRILHPRESFHLHVPHWRQYMWHETVDSTHVTHDLPIGRLTVVGLHGGYQYVLRMIPYTLDDEYGAVPAYTGARDLWMGCVEVRIARRADPCGPNIWRASDRSVQQPWEHFQERWVEMPVSVSMFKMRRLALAMVESLRFVEADFVPAGSEDSMNDSDGGSV